MALLVAFEHESIPLRERSGEWFLPDARGGGGSISESGLAQLSKFGDDTKVGKAGSPWSIGFPWRVRTGRCVGLAQVGETQVEVLPKIWAGDAPSEERVACSRLGLLEMLTTSGLLPPHVEEEAAQSVADTPLHEILIGQFLRALKRALLDGPWLTYVPTRRDLPALRGRLDFGRLASRGHVVDVVPCRFLDFTEDHLLHRVLRWTAWRCRAWSRHAPHVRDASRLVDQLDAVALTRCDAADCDRIVLHRANRRFEAALRWARTLLSADRPSLGSGDTRAFSLLFDMSEVYETYLGALAGQALDGIGVPRLQWSIGHLLRRAGATGAKVHRRQVPDMLVARTDGQPIVVDAKYKHFPGWKAAEADLRQVATYAELVRGDGPVPETVLLYPCSRGRQEELLQGELVVAPGRPGRARVTLASIDLQPLEWGSAGRLQIVGRLRTLFQAVAG